MWGFMVLLLGMMFHTRSNNQKSKSRSHRKFYKQGRMTDELDALDALNNGLDLEQRYEKRRKK